MIQVWKGVASIGFSGGAVSLRVTLHIQQGSWTGTARVLGLPRGLMEVLGEEARITTADGRAGRCIATAADTQDSVWDLRIQGIGPLTGC